MRAVSSFHVAEDAPACNLRAVLQRTSCGCRGNPAAVANRSPARSRRNGMPRRSFFNSRAAGSGRSRGLCPRDRFHSPAGWHAVRKALCPPILQLLLPSLTPSADTHQHGSYEFCCHVRSYAAAMGARRRLCLATVLLQSGQCHSSIERVPSFCTEWGLARPWRHVARSVICTAPLDAPMRACINGNPVLQYLITHDTPQCCLRLHFSLAHRRRFVFCACVTSASAFALPSYDGLIRGRIGTVGEGVGLVSVPWDIL